MLLEVRDLKTQIKTDHGIVRAVEGVSFTLRAGQTLGIVGESGCGKSITALSIMGLLPGGNARIAGGEILYRRADGKMIDLAVLAPGGAEMRAIRGNEIAMVFQEPMSSLNPVYTIGDQIMESVLLHQKVDRVEARKRAITMLDLVGIPASNQRVDEYPHQLSGGMRQRVMIAMALSCNPRLLVADEPTTALDVTVQAQILALIKDLQSEFNMALILITHDLGVVREVADTVSVMYFGNVVEQADVARIFKNPTHPYTQRLLKAIPRIGSHEKLQQIDGSVPSAYAARLGCEFAARCLETREICQTELPEMKPVEAAHYVRCWQREGATGTTDK
ncbi:MAG TPA: ABC transporter ATP-binding protein [Devosia sp.]|nr:ABC transporter ATP-binding protein [Devosia sp.]